MEQHTLSLNTNTNSTQQTLSLNSFTGNTADTTGITVNDSVTAAVATNTVIDSNSSGLYTFSTGNPNSNNTATTPATANDSASHGILSSNNSSNNNSDSSSSISNSSSTTSSDNDFDDEDEDDDGVKYEHLGIEKRNVAVAPMQEPPYCVMNSPVQSVTMNSSGASPQHYNGWTGIGTRAGAGTGAGGAPKTSSGSLYTGVYSAQPMTLRDWFLVLDNQIRKDGRDVSLSKLYLKRFEDEDITMHTLTLLTEADLVAIGVNKIGHRKLIMEAIAAIPRSGESVIVSTSLAQSVKPPNPLAIKMDTDAFPPFSLESPMHSNNNSNNSNISFCSSPFGPSAQPAPSMMQLQQQQQQQQKPQQSSLFPSSGLPGQHQHQKKQKSHHKDEVALRLSSAHSGAAIPVAQCPANPGVLFPGIAVYELPTMGMSSSLASQNQDQGKDQGQGTQQQQQQKMCGKSTSPHSGTSMADAGGMPSYITRRGSVGSNEDAARRRKREMEVSMLISNVQLGEKIGEGSFGEVYLATWHGNTVAAKKTKDLAFGSEIYSEYQTYVRIRHPNCVTFYGIYQEDFYLYLITEYMPDGSLRDFLQAHPGAVPLKMLLGFAQDVAAGMKYLSSLGILHRDLASRNVLLKRTSVGLGLVAKVSDFGLSRMVTPQHDYYRSASSLMPIQWSAPEALRDKRFSSKNDVWSYGVLLWELFSDGAQPYAAIPNNEIRAYIEDGNRLDRPATCPEVVYAFMRRCWDRYETGRPDFGEVLSFITAQHAAAPEPPPAAFAALGLGLGLGLTGATATTTTTGGTADLMSTSATRAEDPVVLAPLPQPSLSPGPADLVGMSILKLKVVRSYSLQQLYDEAMGHTNPSASLSFAIALYQYGDLIAAYGELSELIRQTSFAAAPTDQVWVQVFLVRGAFNARFGDFPEASNDFCCAASIMKALNITSILVSTVRTDPEGENNEFSKIFALSDILCASGLTKFHHAMALHRDILSTGGSNNSLQQQQHQSKLQIMDSVFSDSKKLFKAALGYVSNDRSPRVRGAILFNIGQAYFFQAIYARAAFPKQRALLEKALKYYDYAHPFCTGSHVSPDIHFMKAKALALLGLRDKAQAETEAAVAAAVECGVSQPQQYRIDLESNSNSLLEPTDVPAGVVVAKKTYHDFKQPKRFAAICCSYCGSALINFRPTFCCSKCSYVVHEQCLPYVERCMCFTPAYYLESNKEVPAIASLSSSSSSFSSSAVSSSSSSSSSAIPIALPSSSSSVLSSSPTSAPTSKFRFNLIYSIYSLLNSGSTAATQKPAEPTYTTTTTTTTTSSSSSGDDAEKTAGEMKNPIGINTLPNTRSATGFGEAGKHYKMCHIHAFHRVGGRPFEHCALCSAAMTGCDKGRQCVECKILVHDACLKRLKTYLILHPAEFPVINVLPMCGISLFRGK